MLDREYFENLGEKGINFFTTIYEIFILFIESLASIPKIWFYRRQLVEQLYNFSAKTLPIAAIISIFVGLGSTVQGTYQSSGLIPRYVTVNVIFKSTVIELSPVILALVLAGKLGASLAAEIGSMRISEQIEALETMSLDPVGFLVMPRVIAGLIMLPVITIFANFLAIFSSFFVSTAISQWVTAHEFVNGLKMDYKSFEIIFGCIIKPAVYGFFISLIGSYFGLKTKGGAKGVGESSTLAVVVSAIMIVIFDYYLGELLL